MTRRTLIKLIACASIFKGVWDLGTFVYPFLFLPSPVAIKVSSFVGGVLAVFAGVSLFELSEAGRKFFIFLSSVTAAISASVGLWLFATWKDGSSGSTILFFEEVIFKSESRFVSTGIIAIFAVIPTLIIIFLSQRKTKEIFTREIITKPDSKASTESM